MVRPPGRLAVLEGAPAPHLVAVQLENPGHHVLPRRRTILVPMPLPPDQRECSAAPRLGVVLEQLLQLNRLLHTTRSSCRPHPRRLDSLPQPLHRVQFNLGIEGADERLEIPLVEAPDELTNRIVGHERPSRQGWSVLYFFGNPSR